jgi:cystine transport system substrate-binding protein
VNKLPIKEVGPILTYQLSAPAMAKNQPALRDAVRKAIRHACGWNRWPRLDVLWLRFKRLANEPGQMPSERRS